MMITIDANYVYLLISSNALLLAIACFVLARFLNRCKQVEEFWASPTGAALTENGDDGSAKQIQLTEKLEKRVGELQRTVKVIEMKVPKSRSTIEGNLPIENAQRMAKLGASIDDLTKNCGLNIGEARLMRKLHGKASIASSGS